MPPRLRLYDPNGSPVDTDIVVDGIAVVDATRAGVPLGCENEVEELKLLILCVDGLDPGFAKEHGFSMEYQSTLSIPKELYKDGKPWTPFVWPSIFAGKIEVDQALHQLVLAKKTNWLRLLIRQFLISRGISWTRVGTKTVWKGESPGRLIHMPRVAKDLVVDDYTSFLYHVPCVSNDYFYGRYLKYAELEWEQFNTLASFSRYIDKDIVALYTSLLDKRGHSYIEGNRSSEEVLLGLYKSVFNLVDLLGGVGNIMLVSDHGTIGNHTPVAYLGCTSPIRAQSVLEVRNDIERILGGKST